MKSQRVMFKWLAMAFALAVLFAFALVSPSASAQEGMPPASTETPTELSPDKTYFPTMVPTPTPEPEEAPLSFSMQGANEPVPLSTDWSTPLNISGTDSNSTKPGIAVDSNGGIHVVWTEIDSGGVTEIYYKYRDGTGSWSTLINVSNSNTFDSNNAQVIADSNGKAHIVWEEQDDDYAWDAEILYSQCANGVCTFPVSLSGPPNWDCGMYLPNLQDWHSEVPVIGLDQAGRLMVEWLAYEPGENTMPYSTWLNSGTPPLVRSECVPSGAGIYRRAAGISRIMGGLPGDFRLAFEEIRGDGSQGIYYSHYSNSRWATSFLATGRLPDLFLDVSSQAHVTWCGSDGKLRYWNSAILNTETILNVTCSWHSPIATDATGLPHVFWEYSGQIYESTRLVEGWSERVNISRSSAGAYRPDVVADTNGNLHMVWHDLRDGNSEIYYSTTSAYDCSGTTLSHIGQAVFDVVGEQNYCLNKFEKLTFIEDPSSGRAAFQEFAELASQAKYEVDFTTMIWSRGAGRIFISGVKELYEKVKLNPNDYPKDVRVRILLGLEHYPDPGDQRKTVLRALDSLDVPLEDFGGKWKVEIATYRNSKAYWGFDRPNLHSHVKILIVDGQSAIVSGYNLQDLYTDSSVIDAGLKISGPIVQDSLIMFDDLWRDARGCKCVIGFNCEYTTAPLEHASEVLSIQPDASDPTNVFSLFRDETLKTADNAITAAIRASNINLNLLQNRYFENYPPKSFCIKDWCIDIYLPVSLPVPGDNGSFPYTQAIIDAAKNGVQVQMLLSGDKAEVGINSDSIENLRTQILLLPNGTDVFSNITVKFSDGPLHAKALSIDNQFVVVGSQNFDNSAFGIDPDNLMDLAEYSFGVDNRNVANTFDNEFASLWNVARAYIRVVRSIQQAVDQALPGTIVYVPVGTYHESVIINKPLTLIGDSVNSPVIESVESVRPSIQITSSNVNISHLIVRHNDGYGIALMDVSSNRLKDVRISNVIFDNNSSGGILIQGLIPSSPIRYTLENNTFVGGQSGVTLNLFETQQWNSVIRNNIFIGQSTTPFQILSTDDGGVEYSYNLFSICGSTPDCSTGWYTGNLSSMSTSHDNLFNLDPQFLDPTVANYHLSPISPLIDAGDPNTIYFSDYDDNTSRIDIGAFESFISMEQLPPLTDDIPNAPGLVSVTSQNNINLRYFLSPSGDEDWFRFFVPRASQLEIHLTSLPANYDLYVYNAAGQLLGSSVKEKKAAEVVKINNATSGYYYVRIVGFSGAWNGANPYQLRFNVTGTGGP
ncbi:MAG TPA: phospholipase D-like domain-containing protein [Anaerolineales bacterium]|nr:phospholipase D-like domain-containing protein [Anaerolineales bacterium]